MSTPLLTLPPSPAPLGGPASPATPPEAAAGAGADFAALLGLTGEPTPPAEPQPAPADPELAPVQADAPEPGHPTAPGHPRVAPRPAPVDDQPAAGAPPLAVPFAQLLLPGVHPTPPATASATAPPAERAIAPAGPPAPNASPAPAPDQLFLPNGRFAPVRATTTEEKAIDPAPTAEISPTPSVAAQAPAATAAPTATPAGPAPVRQPELHRAVEAVIARRHLDGTHAVHVALHPVELGSVEVRATLRHGSLEVTVACADEHARAAVEAALPDLHRQLSAPDALDIRIEPANLGAATPGGSGNGERAPADAPAGRPVPQRASAGDDQQPPPRRQQPQTRSGGLDRWA